MGRRGRLDPKRTKRCHFWVSMVTSASLLFPGLIGVECKLRQFPFPFFLVGGGASETDSSSVRLVGQGPCGAFPPSPAGPRARRGPRHTGAARSSPFPRSPPLLPPGLRCFPSSSPPTRRGRGRALGVPFESLPCDVFPESPRFLSLLSSPLSRRDSISPFCHRGGTRLSPLGPGEKTGTKGLRKGADCSLKPRKSPCGRSWGQQSWAVAQGRGLWRWGLGSTREVTIRVLEGRGLAALRQAVPTAQCTERGPLGPQGPRD